MSVPYEASIYVIKEDYLRRFRRELISELTTSTGRSSKEAESIVEALLATYIVRANAKLHVDEFYLLDKTMYSWVEDEARRKLARHLFETVKENGFINFTP